MKTMTTTGRWTTDGPPAVEAGYGIAPRGYRLPDATRLGRVSLQVADLARSLAYYGGVLGFRVLDEAEGRATLAAHGDDTPLVELHERKGAAPVPHRGKLGLFHFAILLPDRAALGRLVAHLPELGERAGASDHLVSEALYLHDPDGLGIEVYADRPRSTWRHQGRQLVMATEPLDIPDLLRAADFYHGGLGLDGVVWSYPSALFLSAGGYHHHLGLNTWAGPGAVPPAAADARLLEWEVLLPGAADAEAAARSLADAGGDVVRDERGWTTPDPWGTVLRLVAR